VRGADVPKRRWSRIDNGAASSLCGTLFPIADAGAEREQRELMREAEAVRRARLARRQALVERLHVLCAPDAIRDARWPWAFLISPGFSEPSSMKAWSSSSSVVWRWP
jgi:hypothetical protein